MKKNSYSLFNNILLGVGLFLIIAMAGCSNNKPVDREYLQEIEEWHERRINSLKESDSWLSLAGLFWLKEGENSFGSSQENQLKFPSGKCPAEMGRFLLQDSSVSVQINENVAVFYNDQKISTMTLKDDSQGAPDVLRYGSLSWYIIQRGNRYGVRLKDSESDLLKNFKGIERFPVDPDWRVTANFLPYDSVKIIEVPNILGTIGKDPSPGKLVFQINGQNYALDPIAAPEDKRWFIIFSDATSGEETYGAGRFLYIDAPGDNQTAIIDFNKSYNPPCAFTPYATCPLPPEQNHLALRVTAGEKNYQGYAH